MNLAKSIEACAAHGAQLVVLQELHTEREVRIETIIPAYKKAATVKACLLYTSVRASAIA